MFAHVYLEGGDSHARGKNGPACAGTEASDVSEKSLPQWRTQFSGDIWHEKMVAHNLRMSLVGNIAREYANSGMAISELVREGSLGLDHALKNFETEGGSHFSTYAARCIRRNIGRAILLRSENSPSSRASIGTSLHAIADGCHFV